ncbi:hypothetical protein [Tissierella sp. P1]|uniref:hypothetical protein n=1 Tax=Tissierella sp. P1 TaxID=1280483 RepID=UPI001F2E9DD0|nr:hypothetical protein [Tissierella sp. P1]
MSHIQYFDWGNIEWIYEPDTKNSTNIMHIALVPYYREKDKRSIFTMGMNNYYMFYLDKENSLLVRS